MNKLVIIGASELQSDLIVEANSLGYETHVFAWNEGAIAKDIVDYFYPISIIEVDKIYEKVKEIAPVGICSIATDLGNVTVNKIGNRLGLPVNSLWCNLYTTNKLEMKKQLIGSNIPCAYYKSVTSFSDLNEQDFQFPVIVKPIDRSGSRGVQKVEAYSQIENAIKIAQKESFTDNVLVEEFIEGKEYSIETISFNGKHKCLQITEKYTTGAPNFVEFAHIAPAILSKGKRKIIEELTYKALDALQVTQGASHSELKIDENGNVKFIEIGSRMGGDFIGSQMVKISSGINFVQDVINIATGGNYKFQNVRKLSNALVFYAFTKEDIIKLQLLRKKYPSNVKSYSIKDEINYDISDSSERNGYIVMDVKDDKIFEEIVAILEIQR